MRAVRYHRAGRSYTLQCDEVPAPACGPAEVRIRVATCGICGSDVARYRQISTPPATLLDLFGQISFIPGHEFSGIIDQTGAAVTAHWEDGTPVMGTRVAVNPLLGCGECAACRAEEWNYCEHPERGKVVGVHRDGGFAEWVTIPFDHVVRLGEDVTLEAAALAEPLAVAFHSVNVVRLKDPATRVHIIGDGVIGLAVGQVLKQRGYRAVSLSGKHPERIAMARAMGLESTPESGRVDCVFQVAGSQEALESGMEMLAVGGEMVCLGYLEAANDGVGALSFNTLIRHQKTLHGSFGYTRAEFQTAVSALSEEWYHPLQMIGARISLDEIVTCGFEALLKEPRPAGKVLVVP